MKKTFLMLLGLFIALTATAQQKAVLTGNGKMVKEKRELTGTFSKLNISGPFDVKLVSGNGKLILRGEENLLPLITTEVSNGTLSIGTVQPLKPGTNKKIYVEIPYEQLVQLRLTGPGNVTVNPAIRNNIDIMLDGSGSVRLAAKNNTLKACVLGSGSIRLKGSTASLECRVIGSGTVNSIELDADNVNALVSGSGNVNALSNYSIIGRISGSGTIAFSGNPKEQDLKRIGTGEFSLY